MPVVFRKTSLGNLRMPVGPAVDTLVGVGDGSPFESGVLTPDRDPPMLQGGVDVDAVEEVSDAIVAPAAATATFAGARAVTAVALHDVVEEKPATDLIELLAMLKRDEKQEVREAGQEILAVIRSIGGDQSRYW